MVTSSLNQADPRRRKQNISSRPRFCPYYYDGEQVTDRIGVTSGLGEANAVHAAIDASGVAGMCTGPGARAQLTSH